MRVHTVPGPFRHECIHTCENRLSCGTCGEGFIQKQNLVRHEHIDKGFIQKQNLVRHEHMNKGFIQKQNLVRHEHIDRVKKHSNMDSVIKGSRRIIL
jgi:hypothetical protein